jgi:predicted phage tail protein
MQENLQIAAFVFGAILVLIALLGGNFKLFGAEVAATVSNRLLRFVAFALGAALLFITISQSLTPTPTPTSSFPTPTPTPTSSFPTPTPTPTSSFPTPTPTPTSSF